MNYEDTNAKNKRLGIIFGVLSYLMWGLLPLFWKQLKQVPADQILAHRILWSFVFVGILILTSSKTSIFIYQFKDKKKLFYLSLCTLMIGINWFLYIWAVNAGHVIETSMGYYINPLLSVILGLTVLKEKMHFSQYFAFALAGAGVMVMVVEFGRVPWIALTLAVTFAIYGLLKKLVHLESTVGLAVETAILTPFAFGYIFLNEVNGTGALRMVSLATIMLLLSSGIATATPLLLFAKAANRVELSTLGFIQYISPTITLILGIFIFHEEFTHIHMISFGLIWAALLVFSLSRFLSVIPGLLKGKSFINS